ncbi:MAG: hypothetical protein ACI9LO_001768 [Planctomycetota bacterium]
MGATKLPFAGSINTGILLLQPFYAAEVAILSMGVASENYWSAMVVENSPFTGDYGCSWLCQQFFMPAIIQQSVTGTSTAHWIYSLQGLLALDSR